MVIDQPEMRRRVERARVAHVGTLDERGRVHLVPMVFVIEGDTVYSSSDDDGRVVKRLRNVARDPRVTLMVDEYDEDWAKVWWVRMRGNGRAIEGGPEHEHARRLLAAKYPQYEGDPGQGLMMAIDIQEWSGWAYAPIVGWLNL